MIVWRPCQETLQQILGLANRVASFEQEVSASDPPSSPPLPLLDCFPQQAELVITNNIIIIIIICQCVLLLLLHFTL